MVSELIHPKQKKTWGIHEFDINDNIARIVRPCFLTTFVAFEALKKYCEV